MGLWRSLDSSFRARVQPLVAIAASLCLVGGGAVGIVGLAATPASAATVTSIVSSGAFAPGNPIGQWALPANTGSHSFVAGPAPTPGGVGSLAISVVPANHKSVYNYAYGACVISGASCVDPSAGWTKLTDVTALKFSTYRTSGDQAGGPTINVEIDPNPAGGGLQHYTTLVFIPTYGSVANAVWQTWNGLSTVDGTWYSSTNLSTDFPGTQFACVFQAAGCDASWTEILADYPNARIRFGLGPNVGSGGNFVGNIDNFTVGLSGNTTVYDFEPACTTVCYVSTTGSDSSTGVSPAQAFRTVQHAIETVSVNGTVIVAAGTYNEAVTVNKTISLLGAQTGVDARTRAGSESILAPPSVIPAGQTPLSVTADNATVDGFTVQGNTYVPLVGAGVYLAPGSHGTQFVNNIVKNNVVGLFLANDNGAFPTLIQHNLFTDNQNPGSASGHDIYADDSTAGGVVDGATINANKFTNSTFKEDAWGLGISNVSAIPFTHIAFTNNSIDNHGRGAYFFSTTNSTVTGNTFTPSATLNHYGIGLFNFGGSDTNTNISINHNLLGCATACVGSGVDVEGGDLAAGAGIAVNRNDVSKFTNGIFSDTTAPVNATCNWWGAGNGPGPIGTGTGSGVTTGVAFQGWLLTSNLDGGCPNAPTLNQVGLAGPTSVIATFTPAPNTGTPRSFTVTCVSLAGKPTVSASGPGSPITVGGMVQGTPYQCTVTETNPAGTSAPSNPISVLPGVAGTGSCRGIPTAPTALSTAPGNASATVSWAPAHGCIAGYIVTPYVGSTAVPELSVLVPGTEFQAPTTTVVKGLTNGVTYTFTVAAENGFVAGPASVPSGSVTAGAPSAITSVKVARVAKGALKVTFKPPANNGAAIKSYTAACTSKNGGKAKSKVAKAGPITVTGLSSGKSYSCTVRATNSRGTGPVSRASVAVKA